MKIVLKPSHRVWSETVVIVVVEDNGERNKNQKYSHTVNIVKTFLFYKNVSLERSLENIVKYII